MPFYHNVHFHRIVRVCTQSVTVNGLEIPKGMSIVIPILLLHTIDEVWDDPHVFRPERYIMILTTQ